MYDLNLNYNNSRHQRVCKSSIFFFFFFQRKIIIFEKLSNKILIKGNILDKCKIK